MQRCHLSPFFQKFWENMDLWAPPLVFYIQYFFKTQKPCFLALLIFHWFGQLVFVPRLSIKNASDNILSKVFASIDPNYAFDVGSYLSFFLALSDRSLDKCLILFNFASRDPPASIHIFLHAEILILRIPTDHKTISVALKKISVH